MRVKGEGRWVTETIYQGILDGDMEPLGRWSQPDDAARLIAWLATDDAHWITGHLINSTGGGP
jgi:3-oxoacyl-[acyl-carrier protein] reductase